MFAVVGFRLLVVGWRAILSRLFRNFTQVNYFRRNFTSRRATRTNNARTTSNFKIKSTTFKGGRQKYQSINNFTRLPNCPRKIFCVNSRKTRITIISARRISLLVCVKRFQETISFRRCLRPRFINLNNRNTALLQARTNNGRRCNINACSTNLRGLMLISSRILTRGKSTSRQANHTSITRHATRRLLVHRSKRNNNTNNFMNNECFLYPNDLICPTFKK